MLDKFKVLRNAETYVVNRQFGRAISEYRSLLETKGEDPALLNTLGDLLLKNKEQAEALSHFRRVAQIFLESGFTNKAIAVCKKIYKLDPTDRETVGQLADLYTKRGFQSQAAKYYRQLVAESRDAGRFQEAADWQKHLLTVLPGEPQPFAEMAELNLELEEANGALGNFVTASWLSFNKGAYQESVEYAEQALSVDELSEAASRLKEVASSVLADGESVLSDPAFQLDDGLFASVVSFKAEESETTTESPAGKKPEELVTAPRKAESSEGTGEPAAKVEEDWSKGQETVDDYSAVGEFAGDAEGEASASEAEVSDELVTAAEAESEPEAETVHELSEDIIDNDLQDVEELLRDVAQVEADSEQHPEDFGMVEGVRLGEQDIRVGGTVDGFERYGEVLGGDEIGESPTEPERPEQSEKLPGAQEEVSTGIDASDEEVIELSDEGQQDSEAIEAAAVEDDAAQDTPEDDRIEGLVGTDEHLQKDILAEAVDETIPEQALASEVDSGESLPTFAEDEQSVSGVVEVPEAIETLEEPLDELVEGDELAASFVPGEDDDIFEVSVEESADEVLERLEEAPSESEEAELGCESSVGEPREDESVLEIADDFSSEELSSVSVEDLFEEAVSAEASFYTIEESLEQTLDVDEIEEFGSKESDTAVTIQGFEPSEDKSASEEESAEHQTIDGSGEESVLDQEFLHKPYDDEPQADREGLEEPKLEAVDQEMFKAFQEPPSFWDKLKDTVMGRSSDVDEEEVADEDASEEVFDAIETVESVAGENVEDERIDDAESGWGFAEVVEGVEEEVVDEQDSDQEELELVAEEAEPLGIEALEEGGESVSEETGEPEEAVELVEEEQLEVPAEEEPIAESEETPILEAVEPEEEVASQPAVEAGEQVEGALEEGVGEEIIFETESERETGVVSPEEVVEPAEAVESLAAEVAEEAAVGEETPETEAWEAVGDASVEESEETLQAEDQIDEASETVRVEDSAEEVKLEADEQTTGEVFEEQHSFWDKLRDAVMGHTSEEDEEEELEAVSDEEVEDELEAVEAAEGDGEEVLETEGTDEEATEFGLVALEDGDESALDREGEPEEQLDLTGEEHEQADTTGEDEWVAKEEVETACEVAQAHETTAEEVVEVGDAVEGAVQEVVEEGHTYEAESEQEAGEAVHTEVVEAAEVAVEEVVNEQDSGREELVLEAVETVEAASEEEAEEELETVSDEKVEDDLKAVEVAEGDVGEIVEHEEADEEEPRYAITDLWRKILKKTLREDGTEDVVEPEEVATIAAGEPESEWKAPQDPGVEDESAEERELEAQENIDAEGEPAEVETLQLAQEDDSEVEPQAEELDHEAPVIDPETEKSRDYRAAVTETWKQPSVFADSSPSRDVEDVTGRDAPTAGWKPESDEAENGDGNGDRKQDLGSLEEALQEYDFNMKLGLREEAERLISQLLAEHAFDERVLLRAKSHGINLPSTEPEPEPVAEGEKTIEDELDSAFEDIFKMPGDEILEDVLVFELDTADNTTSDESKVQYDLGLGYREMGLLDDAVEKFEEAFQVAIDSDDRDHATNCCGMLASTYMELTDYRKVLKWADRGLGLHVAKAFEEKVLQYERAQALEMLGEFRQSLDTYRALMEQDPAFRDVRARVGRLNLLSN